jgi:hypothetical protein
MAFVFWPKIDLWKVLYGKAHCFDTESIFLAKDLVFFSECAAGKIAKIEGRILV